MKLVVIALAFGIVGCASHSRFYGGGVAPPAPRVEMSIVKVEGDFDWQPVAKTPAQAVMLFPLEMRRASIAGEVLATATIDEDGRVRDVIIERASQPEFAIPVLSGLPKCSFFPARRGQVAVRTKVQCKIQFILDDE